MVPSREHAPGPHAPFGGWGGGGAPLPGPGAPRRPTTDRAGAGRRAPGRGRPPRDARAPPGAAGPAPSGASVPEQLIQLDDLRRRGIVTPAEFEALKQAALAKGFLLAASSPLTRSSYHAGEDFQRLRAARLARLAASG